MWISFCFTRMRIWGDDGKEFLTDASMEVSSNENYRNAVQNYNSYINNWE